MSLLIDLERWRAAGTISESQHKVLVSLVRKDRFSVFAELNALLYLGVVAFVAGAGWTIQTHFARLGDVAILSALTLSFAASLYYCFSRAAAYSNVQQESPGFAFDYVLYLGCLMFGLELGFLEFRFHLLQDRWDHYLLLSSVAYFSLAYRFDNRFVLSLALSTLAGWFGLRAGVHNSLFGPMWTRPRCARTRWRTAAWSPSPACSCTEQESSATFSKPTCTSRRTSCSWPSCPVSRRGSMSGRT